MARQLWWLKLLGFHGGCSSSEGGAGALELGGGGATWADYLWAANGVGCRLGRGIGGSNSAAAVVEIESGLASTRGRRKRGHR